MKENKGVSLTGFVITILVVLLALAVVGCVYLLKNPVKETVAVQTPAPATNLNSSNEEKETKMTAEKKFAEYVKNLKNDMQKYNKEEIDGKKYREYFAEGEDLNDKKYSVTLSGNGKLELNEKEVSTNVIGFNVTYVGNGGSQNLYFIKDDGTVAYTPTDGIKYLSNGKVKTTEVKELKNIISIIGGTAGVYDYPAAEYAYAIDIEGNIFEIK